LFGAIYGGAKMRGLALFVAILGFALFATWATVRIVSAVQYDQNCGGYLKRAADANTVDLAKQELSRALTYINANGIKEGYTSVAWRTPDEDLGFWHTNLSASLQELDTINTEASQLEKTNALMKLRETLLDHGDSASVTEPDGISIYPNNVSMAWFGWLSFALMIVGFVFWGFILYDY
jgi:hypothetical protein